MPRRDTPDPLSLAIGRRIRGLRETQGLTLERLAAEAEGGSKGYLSDLEKGLVHPTVQTLARLATRLGVSIVDLLDEPVRARPKASRKLPQGAAALAPSHCLISADVAAALGQLLAASGGAGRDLGFRCPACGAPVVPSGAEPRHFEHLSGDRACPRGRTLAELLAAGEWPGADASTFADADGRRRP